jgi:hypothetical protein
MNWPVWTREAGAPRERVKAPGRKKGNGKGKRTK